MVSGGSDKTRGFGGQRRHQGGNVLAPRGIPWPLSVSSGPDPAGGQGSLPPKLPKWT